MYSYGVVKRYGSLFFFCFGLLLIWPSDAVHAQSVNVVSSRVGRYVPPYDYSGYGISALIRKLSSYSLDERLSAVHVLGGLETRSDRQEALTPLLKSFLSDSNLTLERFAWAALSHYDFRELDLVATREHFYEPLLTRLKAPKTPADLRGMSAELLGRLREHRAVPELIRRLDDSDALVRLRSAEALGLLADSRALNPLKEKVKKASPDSSEHAAYEKAYKALTRRLGQKLRGAAAAEKKTK